MDQTQNTIQIDPAVEYARLKKRNKKIGLTWILGPFITLVVLLIAYAVFSFIISSMANGDSSTGVTILRLARVAMGFIGILAVIGVMIGIPLGIIYLTKRVMMPGAVYDERSGKGDASIVPEEIKDWNWGAAGLTWIWGASHSVWISFLSFIPFVSIVMVFVLGVKGSEWAWKAEKWESVEAFKKAQNKWKVWGIVFFILAMLSALSQLGKMGA